MLLIEDIESVRDIDVLHVCNEKVSDIWCEARACDRHFETDRAFIDHLRDRHSKGLPKCGIKGPRSNGLSCYREHGHTGSHRYTTIAPEDRTIVCKELVGNSECNKRFGTMQSIYLHQQDNHRIPMPRCGYISEDGTKVCIRLPEHTAYHKYIIRQELIA